MQYIELLTFYRNKKDKKSLFILNKKSVKIWFDKIATFSGLYKKIVLNITECLTHPLILSNLNKIGFFRFNYLSGNLIKLNHMFLDISKQDFNVLKSKIENKFEIEDFGMLIVNKNKLKFILLAMLYFIKFNIFIPTIQILNKFLNPVSYFQFIELLLFNQKQMFLEFKTAYKLFQSNKKIISTLDVETQNNFLKYVSMV